MTLEELQKAADEMGYGLYKKCVRPSIPAIKPCICGGEVGETKHVRVIGYSMKCTKCGRKGLPGINYKERVENWNQMIDVLKQAKYAAMDE